MNATDSTPFCFIIFSQTVRKLFCRKNNNNKQLGGGGGGERNLDRRHLNDEIKLYIMLKWLAQINSISMNKTFIVTY